MYRCTMYLCMCVANVVVAAKNKNRVYIAVQPCTVPAALKHACYVCDKSKTAVFYCV